MKAYTIENLNEAAAFVDEKLGVHRYKPTIAVVLGSGLSTFADNLKLKKGASIGFHDIPHFGSSTVDGHKGELILGFSNNQHPIIAMSGRLHFYEGFHAHDVVLPIRTLGRLGIKTLLLTNASGGINDDFMPGQLMVVTDHLNLTGQSPLIGKNLSSLGPRFVDMSEAYDKELVRIAKKASLKADIKMHEGVYAGLLGPCYETPAEVRMLKTLGADAVGMSTVFEVIAARHMGMKVLALSCITNKGAGLSQGLISHQEVMENNAKITSKLEIILNEVIDAIGGKS